MRHMVLKTSRLALMFAILILSAALVSAGFKSADIDGNGLVDIVDLVMVRDAVNASADVNNDGAINDIDVNFVKNLLGTTIGALSRIVDLKVDRKFAPPGHTVTVTIRVFDFDGTDSLPLEGTAVKLTATNVPETEMDYMGIQDNKGHGVYQASFNMPNADPVSIQISAQKGPGFIQTSAPDAVRLILCSDSDGENINAVGTASGANEAFNRYASIPDSCIGDIMKNTDNNGGYKPIAAESVCLSDQRASIKEIGCPSDQGCINGACQRLPDDDGDGVLDPVDNCPDEYGSPEKAGCPLCSQFNKPVCQSRPSECTPVYENVKVFDSCNSEHFCGRLTKDRCQANPQYCKANIRYERKCIGAWISLPIFGRSCAGIPYTDEIFDSCSDNYNCNQNKDISSCVSPKITYDVKRRLGAPSFRTVSYTFSNRVCGTSLRDTQVFGQCLEIGQISPNPKYSPLRPDSDGDGLLDVNDNCPKEKGTLENKGCPISNPCTSLTLDACGQRSDCREETTDEESCQKKFLFWCVSKTSNPVQYCAGTQCNLQRDQCIAEYSKCTLRNADSNECVTSKTDLAKKVIDACAGKTTDLACVKGDNVGYVIACDTKNVIGLGPKGICEKDKAVVGININIVNGLLSKTSVTSIKDLKSYKEHAFILINNKDNEEYISTNPYPGSIMELHSPNSVNIIAIKDDDLREAIKEADKNRQPLQFDIAISNRDNLRIRSFSEAQLARGKHEYFLSGAGLDPTMTKPPYYTRTFSGVDERTGMFNVFHTPGAKLDTYEWSKNLLGTRYDADGDGFLDEHFVVIGEYNKETDEHIIEILDYTEDDDDEAKGFIGGGRCGRGCHTTILENTRMLHQNVYSYYNMDYNLAAQRREQIRKGQIREGFVLHPHDALIRDAARWDSAITTSVARRAPGRGGVSQDPIQVISID